MSGWLICKLRTFLDIFDGSQWNLFFLTFTITYTHTHTKCVHIHTHVHLHTRIHVCIYKYKYIYMYIYIGTYVCAYTHTCTYICIHIHIYTCVRICTYTVCQEIFNPEKNVNATGRSTEPSQIISQNCEHRLSDGFTVKCDFLIPRGTGRGL